MAHKRKDTLVASPQWWKHLREFKRFVSKAERRAAKFEIDADINEPDEIPKGLGLHNDPKEMAFDRSHAGGGVALIPYGIYCYDDKGKCPFLDRADNKPVQENGYCWFLRKGDWDEGIGELWDACKCCGQHDEFPPGYTFPARAEKRKGV